jgi:hypothetical protein
MKLELCMHGHMFATRERARELAALVASEHGDVVVDFSHVTASPSFVAELLSVLCRQHRAVIAEGASEHLEGLVRTLAGKLGLTGQVRVAALA